MKTFKYVLDEKGVDRAISRMTTRLKKLTDNFKDTVIIGIRPRGIHISERIAREINRKHQIIVPTGIIDVTLYRDDLSNMDFNLNRKVLPTNIPESIDDKVIVLVDTSILTGRTTRAALDALIDFGRPEKIILAELIDATGQREVLCINPNVVGKKVKTQEGQRIQVKLLESDGEDRVLIVEEGYSL